MLASQTLNVEGSKKALAYLDSSFLGENKHLLNSIDPNISSDSMFNEMLLMSNKFPHLNNKPVVYIYSVKGLSDKVDYVFVMPYIDFNSPDTENMKSVLSELKRALHNFGVNEVKIPLTSHNQEFRSILDSTIDSAKVDVFYIN